MPFDIDKTVGYWVESAEYAPYTHSLVLLAKNASIDINDQMLDQLAEYMEFHIEARYPDEKKDFYKKCSEEFTAKKIDEMDKVYKWLKKRLNK